MTQLVSRKSFGTFLIKDQSSLVIPKEACLALHLEDKGEVFEMIVEDGRVILEPKFTVPKGEEQFWTEEWQAGEREADEDIKAGRGIVFENAEDAIKYLHSGEHNED